MIETSETIVALTAGIIKVQGSISGVHKDAKNPHFKSRYASLENVIDTARPALQEAGIAFVQAPGAVIDGSVEITTMLVHSSGEWMRATLHVPLGKRDPQGVGSAITYGCRYSLMAMLGLPPTDDDAESATDHGNGYPAQTPNTVTGPAIAKRTSVAALKKNLEWEDFIADLYQCRTVGQINGLYKAIANPARQFVWTREWLEQAVEACAAHKADVLAVMTDDDTFPGDLPSNPVNILAGG